MERQLQTFFDWNFINTTPLSSPPPTFVTKHENDSPNGRLKGSSKERKKKEKKKSRKKKSNHLDNSSDDDNGADNGKNSEDEGILLATLLNRGTNLGRDIDSALSGNLPQRPESSSGKIKSKGKDNTGDNTISSSSLDFAPFDSEAITSLVECGEGGDYSDSEDLSAQVSDNPLVHDSFCG